MTLEIRPAVSTSSLVHSGTLSCRKRTFGIATLIAAMTRSGPLRMGAPTQHTSSDSSCSSIIQFSRGQEGEHDFARRGAGCRIAPSRTSGYRDRLAAGGGADLHDFAVAEDRKMYRLARRVPQLLDEGPGYADEVHISGVGAAELEQPRPQRIGAGFVVLLEVMAARQRLKQAMCRAYVDAGGHGDLGYRSRPADGPKVLENIEHLGDCLDCRAFLFATNGANHLPAFDPQFTNDVGST